MFGLFGGSGRVRGGPPQLARGDLKGARPARRLPAPQRRPTALGATMRMLPTAWMQRGRQPGPLAAAASRRPPSMRHLRARAPLPAAASRRSRSAPTRATPQPAPGARAPPALPVRILTGYARGEEEVALFGEELAAAAPAAHLAWDDALEAVSLLLHIA